MLLLMPVPSSTELPGPEVSAVAEGLGEAAWRAILALIDGVREALFNRPGWCGALRPGENTTPISSLALRRPPPGGMDQREDPQGLACDLVPEAIAVVRDRLAGAGNSVRPAQMRIFGQPGGRVAEQLVDLHGRSRVFLRDVVPHVGAVLLRLCHPADFYFWLVTLARRAASSASTSSFDCPAPASMEERAASSLRCWRGWSKCRASRRRSLRVRVAIDALFASLQHRAFRGEL